MKDILKLGGLLMLFTAIAATCLASIYSITKPRIEEQKKLVIARALSVALPEANENTIIPVGSGEDVLYYKGYASPDTTGLVGYAFIARGSGYSSVIETMVGVDTSGNIQGMKVLSQTETPGLGTKVEAIKYGESEPYFTRQFLGKQAGNVAVKQDNGNIDSITGATISSRALTNSVARGYTELQKEINN